MYANSYSITINKRIILTGVCYRNKETSQQSKLKKCATIDCLC